MKKFIFAIHNHQPVGNFDHVIREAFEKSYKPFIDLVYTASYPKICFHFSGILYEWLEKNEKSYIDKLAEMVLRDQIEILGGGYYEPILAVIPKRDRVSQINKLSEYIYKRFGKYPRGLWLTERVFRDDIVEDIYDCGIEYILVDDSHLFTSGLKSNELNNLFITEYNGKKVKVFVIDHNLRYLIPYADVNKVIDYLNSFSDGIFVMADDGEKFGLWPESYNLVYERRWLYNFFESIKNSSIEMSRFMDVNKKAEKIVYIPNTSYFEMTTWALNYNDSNAIKDLKEGLPDELKKFVKGGMFHNFFTKYYHSNFIHKKSYYISKLIEENFNQNALDYLHMAQCNCGWWHGVFGGIYLPHIRMAIYENFLKAQKIIFNKKAKDFEINVFDIDFDDRDEIIVESKNNFFVISPSYGGSLIEFSSKNKLVNYSGIIERLPEAYHFKPQKDIHGNIINNISEEIFYDWHMRRSLLDHFIKPDTDINSFSKARYFEQGDFIPQEYKFSYKYLDGVYVELKRRGSVWEYDKKLDVEVLKEVYISEFDGFDVNYRVKNLSDIILTQRFGIEFSFAFASDKGFHELKDVREYIFEDFRGNVKLEFSIPLKLWIFPINTISNSESGGEKIYQGSVILAIYDGDIKQYEDKEIFIKIRIL